MLITVTSNAKKDTNEIINNFFIIIDFDNIYKT